jgi:hypothetical protein
MSGLFKLPNCDLSLEIFMLSQISSRISGRNIRYIRPHQYPVHPYFYQSSSFSLAPSSLTLTKVVIPVPVPLWFLPIIQLLLGLGPEFLHLLPLLLILHSQPFLLLHLYYEKFRLIFIFLLFFPLGRGIPFLH